MQPKKLGKLPVAFNPESTHGIKLPLWPKSRSSLS